MSAGRSPSGRRVSVLKNDQFPILPSVRMPRLSPLSPACARVADAWEHRHSARPILLHSYARPDRTGASYRAASWGRCPCDAGRHARQVVPAVEPVFKFGRVSLRVFSLPEVGQVPRSAVSALPMTMSGQVNPLTRSEALPLPVIAEIWEQPSFAAALKRDTISRRAMGSGGKKMSTISTALAPSASRVSTTMPG